MTERKFTDDDVMRALNMCCKWQLFCRSRFDMPDGVQNADIMQFAKDIDFISKLITRLSVEIEHLPAFAELAKKADIAKMARTVAIKEFAEKLKDRLIVIPTVYNSHYGRMIDNLVKEMTEGKQ